MHALSLASEAKKLVIPVRYVARGLVVHATGSVVEPDISLPELAGYHTVHANVVHVAPRRGVRVQFIGGDDAFGSDLDRYLEQLGR